MMLPRLAMFKSDRMNINHLVFVDGDVMKPICIRMPVKHGHLLAPDAALTCENCRNKGWTKSLGRIGSVPVETDSNGRFLSRESIS